MEPLAYLLYTMALLFFSLKIDRHFRFKTLLVYYIIGTILYVIASITSLVFDHDNTQIYNLLYPVISLSLSYYFFHVLQARIEKTIAVLTGLVTLLYYAFNIHEIYFDSLGYVTASTGIVLLIFLYFHQVLSNVNEEPLSLNFDFWYVCTQLVYHLGSFAIFLTYNYLTYRYFEVPERREIGTILTYLWVVHNVLLFLGSIAVSVGIVWIYRKRSPSS